MQRGATPPDGLFVGKNLMTQSIVEYGKIEGGWYEISEGRGFYGERIYGVTIRPREAGKSKMVFSLSQALDYLKSLEEEEEDSE